MMNNATPQKMRLRAQAQDEGRLAILSLVVAAACTSLLAIRHLHNSNVFW
jgi:uncharacterized membrane protein